MIASVARCEEKKTKKVRRKERVYNRGGSEWIALEPQRGAAPPTVSSQDPRRALRG